MGDKIQTLDEAKLEVLINKWQSKLKLQHWQIDFKFATKEELEGSYHAKCRYHLSILRAEILVITKEEFPKIQKDNLIWEEYNLEETVIHELVHLILAPSKIGDDDTEEQAVNLLTRIIYGQHLECIRLASELINKANPEK